MGIAGKILYFIGWSCFRLFFTVIFRLKIKGLDNIPKKGGVIITSNHVSLADPPLIGSSIHRPIFYMAKKELFKGLFGWILHKVNAFPIEREGGDIKAMRKAKKVLQDGGTLLMFPQGTRKHEDDFESKNGAGILSCWTHSPIVPCCVINTNNMKQLKKMEVHFSVPIYPPQKYTRDDYELLTNNAINDIKKMRDHYRNETDSRG